MTWPNSISPPISKKLCRRTDSESLNNTPRPDRKKTKWALSSDYGEVEIAPGEKQAILMRPMTMLIPEEESARATRGTRDYAKPERDSP